jgi:hypothetical protein
LPVHALSCVDFQNLTVPNSADYLCCVEPDQHPRFKFHPSSNYPILDKTASPDVEIPIGFQNLSTVINLDQEYLDIILDIEHFSTSFRLAKAYHVRKTLRPHDYDVTPLRYRLLSMANARRSGTQKELVQEACRIGTLVFLKTVFDKFGCWGPSHKVRGRPYKFIVEKLKVYLTMLDHSANAMRTEYLELLLWLSFMGGVLQLEYVNRQWYNAHIATTAAKLGLSKFDDVKTVLCRFLWIEWVHEKHCAELWEDVLGDPQMQKATRQDWGIAAQSL